MHWGEGRCLEGSVNIKFWGKLLQTFLNPDCGTLPISGEAQVPKLILPFSVPFTLPDCCFCQSLYSFPSLSLRLLPSLYVSKSLFSYSFFLFFLVVVPLNSPLAIDGFHTHFTVSASWDLDIPLYLSTISPLSFGLMAKDQKCLQQGTRQAVCLQLFITVLYSLCGETCCTHYWWN